MEGNVAARRVCPQTNLGGILVIDCKLTKVGDDDLIVVTGGTKPHIGATVIAAFENGEVQILSHGLPHHKEEGIFVEMARVWCTNFKKTTVVLGGIHIDNATKAQIKELVEEAWKAFYSLMEA